MGVISSLDLYVNGDFVGYSEGAHNSAEFDITKYLVEGENEILAVVSKWSTGTYLECQDMFRENGIFRDVLLYEYENTYLYDFGVDTNKNGGNYDLTVSYDIKGDKEGCAITVELYDGDTLLASETADARAKSKITLSNLKVTEWNAEIPTTYDLFVTLADAKGNKTVIKNITGFKTIEIKGNVFYFNGVAIKFKGVNHHDTNMYNGYVLTGEEIKAELELMKEFNINAIRTSHYPPDPTLLTLADIMGFYIVDEADIETHGAGDIKVPYDNDLISHDLKWEGRYVDRVSRMYCRDRNHPSITMWSLGNEAGGYACQDACYDYLKNIGTKIPVHYEGVIRTKRWAYDVISEMYQNQEMVAKIGNRTAKEKYLNKPYFLCEYIHAMGVGPGGVEEYWDSIYKYDNLMGGCVWEWADHAVYHDGTDKYKFQYTYGGDHNEEKHDSNFCVDGMLYPDKTPHTGAYVIKAVYRPVRSKHISGKCFEFTNTNRFKNCNYLTLDWTQLVNGEEVKSGTITLDIDPMQTKTYEIPYVEYGMNDDCHITFTYTEGEQIRGIEQTTLNDVKNFVPKSSTTVGKVSTYVKGDILTVEFDNGKVVFNQKTGEMTNYIVNGYEYLNINPADNKKGFVPNLVRASLDNDSYGQKKPWDLIKLHNATTVCKSFDCADKSVCAKVGASYVIKNGFKTHFRANIVYTVYGDGLVEVQCDLSKGMFGCNELQRFGVTVELPSQFKNVEFYGRGSNEKIENLCDMKDHSYIGIWKTTVEDMHEPYVMPQDNGNCGGTKYLKLSDESGSTFAIYGEPKFSFSAHNYTQKALHKAKHQEEIEYTDTTFVCIDGFMRGTGTNTCGPDTLDKYKVKSDKPLTFKFAFKGE